MVNIGFWNVRGLNDYPRQHDVQSFLLRYNIQLVGFLETKIKIQDKKSTLSFFWRMDYDG